MHKKYYGATIAMAIALCLGGCGEKEEAPAADMEAVMETRETIESDEIITEDRNESEALAFVKDMKIGWNLGNTFDAIDCNWLSDEMQYESSWCGDDKRNDRCVERSRISDNSYSGIMA